MKAYWLSSSDLPGLPALDHDTNADVVVVGAGITGASVCYWLSNRCRVILLERDTIASKASGRNAGFLLTGTSEHYNDAIKRYGHELARTVWRITRKNHELLQRHIFASEECDHQRHGSYLVAASEKEMCEITESTRLLRRDGFNYRLIGKSELCSILSSKDYHGASFNPDDGAVNPVKLVQTLLARAGENGTRLYERSVVRRISSRGEGFRVETDRATVSCNFVVLAANAYAPMLNRYLKGRIAPVRGQMLATDRQPKRFEGVFYANHGYEYWRQTLDGRILAGGFRELDPGRERGYRVATTSKIQRRLEKLLAGLSLKFNVEHRWSGIMAFTKDHLPLIGYLPEAGNLLVSAGYSGHGLGFSFVAGRMISEMILEGRREEMRDLFSPSRPC